MISSGRKGDGAAPRARQSRSNGVSVQPWRALGGCDGEHWLLLEPGARAAAESRIADRRRDESLQGLPVVATAVGGTPEIVLDGETALLVRTCSWMPSRTFSTASMAQQPLVSVHHAVHSLRMALAAKTSLETGAVATIT